jgi:Fur family transcriptional regulator, ferric uptake regulator
LGLDVSGAASADAVAAALRRRGLRVSASRRLIIQILLEAAGPLSAREISTGPNGGSIGLDLASVYRNLEILERHGLADQIHLGQGPGRWMLAGAGEREYLACERCGAIEAVDPDELDEMRASIRERFGYEVAFGDTPMVGLCRRCREDGGSPSDGAETE